MPDDEKSEIDTEEKVTEKKPATNNKLLLVIIAILGFAMIGMGLIIFTPIGNSILNRSGGDYSQGAEMSAEQKAIEARQITFLPLAELIVNLKPYKGRNAILRATFVLQISNEKERENINYFAPIITDQFQTFLREMNITDIQGAAGIERIRQELLTRINQIVKPFKIKEVLVKDFLVQ